MIDRPVVARTLSLVLSCLLVSSGPLELAAQTAPASAPGSVDNQAELLRQLRLLNQIPEEQLNEKVDPAFSIVRTIYDTDGPEFMQLRQLLGQAAIRQTLNASAKSVVAGILSNRWDSFALAGNLWLASLGSPNEEIRNKARKKLVQFIQPAHVPALIEMLAMPKSNLQVYQVLWEITGQKLDPSVKTWRRWWAKEQKHVDIVGHLLKDTRDQINIHPITPFDQDRFWYLPTSISDARIPYAERAPKEKEIITEWNAWANQEPRRYVNSWKAIKPVLDRITHQPDPRVNSYLEQLTHDPGYGDYVSVVLAWRANASSLTAIKSAFAATPSVGRALARGSLGDKTALRDLLVKISAHPSPLTFTIMDDDARTTLDILRTVGVVPAEQAFELLAHQAFDFDGAATRSDKKKATQKAKRWLDEHYDTLMIERRRGYFLSR